MYNDDDSGDDDEDGKLWHVGGTMVKPALDINLAGRALDTEERGLVTETTGERRVSSLAVDETVELPGSGVDMTPEMVLEAGQLSRAEQNLIEQC